MWKCYMKLKKTQELFINTERIKAKSKCQDPETSYKFWLSHSPPPSYYLLPNSAEIVLFQTGEKAGFWEVQQISQCHCQNLMTICAISLASPTASIVRAVSSLCPSCALPPGRCTSTRPLTRHLSSAADHLCYRRSSWSCQGQWLSLGKGEIIKLQ